MWGRFARNGGAKVKITDVLDGVLNSEGARLFLVAGALCGASITVGGAGRVVYDFITDAKAKEAKALLEWRRSKMLAIQASTMEMKGIKKNIGELTEVLKMPRPAAKEPAAKEPTKA